MCQLKCEHKRVNSINNNVILRFKHRFVRFLRYLSFLNFQILNSKLLFFLPMEEKMFSCLFIVQC